jgi:hypothetical protein
MAQAERVGEERRTEQDRIVTQGDDGPEPHHDVGADEKRVKSKQAASNARVAFIPDTGNKNDTLAYGIVLRLRRDHPQRRA